MTFEDKATTSAEGGELPIPSPSAAPTNGSPSRSRRGFLVFTAAIAAAGGAGILNSAHAEAEPNPGASDQAAPNQEKISELNTFIAELPGISTSGYITSVDDSEAGTVTLLWHGPAGDQQKKIVDKGRQLGISISVKQRKYSLQQLKAATTAISGRSGKGAFQNFTVYYPSFTADFDGIVVTGVYINPPAHNQEEAKTALALAASKEFDIDISVNIDPAGIVIPA